MFSNKVKVTRGAERVEDIYDYFVTLPRLLAMAQNWASASWSFIIRHYKPKYFAKFDKFYGFYFKVLDIFVSIHWPDEGCVCGCH